MRRIAVPRKGRGERPSTRNAQMRCGFRKGQAEARRTAVWAAIWRGWQPGARIRLRRQPSVRRYRLPVDEPARPCRTQARAGSRRKLADGIIEAQRREIDEMKALIRDLESPR